MHESATFPIAKGCAELLTYHSVLSRVALEFCEAAEAKVGAISIRAWERLDSRGRLG